MWRLLNLVDGASPCKTSTTLRFPTPHPPTACRPDRPPNLVRRPRLRPSDQRPPPLPPTQAHGPRIETRRHPGIPQRLSRGTGSHPRVRRLQNPLPLLAPRTPPHRHIAKWLSDEVLPTLHDTQHIPDTHPHRAFMTWANQRIGVIKWQGEIWIARRGLPNFLPGQEVWPLRDAPSWRSI